MAAAACGELAGRTALVTGAGRGIGRAIACELAGAGATAVLVGRCRARLDDTAARIERSGGTTRVLVGDVTQVTYLAELDQLAPPIDVAVHNASAYAPFALVESGTDKDFVNVHATVVDGARRLIQHVLPGMKDRGFGRIVSVGSLAGELGGAGQAAYASAKAALIGLTRTVAVEASAYGVTANVVQPGLIDTERVAEAIHPQIRERIVREIPAGRIGRPEEVAYAVAFLASSRAAYITGAVLPVAGGLGLGLFSGREA
jgi:3-oxoacyl-[acyl-carrier protein] reductase